MIEYCVCGHERKRHMHFYNFCYVCGEDFKRQWCLHRKVWTQYKHEFKLDSLKLIEDLAKEKGLV